jgi:hypothetical protein
MTLIIAALTISIIISKYIYKSIKTAPLKYVDEKRFVDAVRYEEKFAQIYENDVTKFSKKANNSAL